jgi:hypothetical protein
MSASIVGIQLPRNTSMSLFFMLAYVTGTDSTCTFGW